MAQTSFINVTAGVVQPDFTYSHVSKHASASAGDLTLSWDPTKFTTRASMKDALMKLIGYIASRGDLT